MTLTETTGTSTEYSGKGNHPNSRSNLKPFKPGQSGNPGGRPKKIKAAEDILIEELVRAAQVKAEGLNSDDEKVRQAVSTEILERWMGKALQRVENKDTTDAKQIDEADLVNIATAGSTGTSET